MKKLFSFIIALTLMLAVFLSYVCAENTVSVAQVEDMLESIDTLEQMQKKRNTITASGHYDIGTTSSTVIARHKKAREKYESYVADMFAKRAEAQKAYDALSDEEKAQIDPSLAEKLSNELPNVFLSGEYPVTPRDDEYSYEAVDGGLGYAYEVGNHMISGSIPQTFILVDTSDGATSWSPSAGEYVYGESNYIVGYCCDKETGLEYGTDYKCINLEEGGYFDEDEAKHIRAILENSYPYVTMDSMKEWLKENGLDGDFVDSLTRADFISAIQMAVWSYANINDAAADGLEYFASIDVPRNTGLYFTAYHDYTNEVWDWLPGTRVRTFDARAQYRVNTLADFLCNLKAVPATVQQTVISEVEVVRTELVSAHDGIYDVTVYVTLNGGGNERDNLEITATAYSENADGITEITDSATKKAMRDKDCYSIDISVKDGDLIKIEIDGKQYLEKGVYFYAPEGGREESQSLVCVGEGYTHVKAQREIAFSEPEYTIIAPDKLEVTIGEKTVLKTEVIPEIGAPDVFYTSSDESIVKVDEKGNIETVGVGTATITAYLKGNEESKVTITVTVELPEYKIETPESMELTVGITELLYVKITPDDGRLKPVFSSDDESIAKVDRFGNVTGVSEGTTTIYIDFGNGEIRAVPVTVKAVAAPSLPAIPQKHHVCFGKTDGIGWYEVSVNGGDFFPQGPNSTLEVEHGSILVVRVQDMWIDDEFDFYVNGNKVPLDPANTITVYVDGYKLIGALSMAVEVPDVEESLTLLQRIVKAFKDFFAWIGSWFR